MNFGVLLLLSLTALQWNCSASYRILAFFPIGFKSHIVPLDSLFYELATRGHKVTVVSAFPPTRNHTNYMFRQIPPSHEQGTWNTSNILESNGLTLIRIMNEFCLRRSQQALQLPEVQHFIQNDKSRYDVIIASLTFCGESLSCLGHKYNAPMINFQPLGYTSSKFHLLGSLLPPTVVPDYRLPFTDKMSFAQVVTNVGMFLLDLYDTNYYYLPRVQKLMDEKIIYPGFESRPSVFTLLRNISMTFIEYDPIIGIAYPVAPNIIFTGGIHLREAKALPPNIAEFMADAPHGVIYISLGSILRLSRLPQSVTEAFVEALRKLKYRVIWKADVNENVSPDVITGDWFPQADILGHPKCMLFVTHGGIHSAMEAGYYGVPVVIMPAFSDQFQNAQFMKELGMGVTLDLFSMTGDKLHDSMEEVINNPRYKENLRRISKSMKTKPVSSLETAVRWTEYVAANQGAPNLSPSSRNLSLMKILGLDVFISFALVTSLIACILVLVKCKLSGEMYRANKNKME